jgi:hypothetical protein
MASLECRARRVQLPVMQPRRRRLDAGLLNETNRPHLPANADRIGKASTNFVRDCLGPIANPAYVQDIVADWNIVEAMHFRYRCGRIYWRCRRIQSWGDCAIALCQAHEDSLYRPSGFHVAHAHCDSAALTRIGVLVIGSRNMGDVVRERIWRQAITCRAEGDSTCWLARGEDYGNDQQQVEYAHVLNAHR